MGTRDQSYRFVENSGDYVVQITRGHHSRRLRIPFGPLVCGALIASLACAGVVGAAAYLLFRDDMLASLLDRQTQMQYAYEDRLAAARLRLDQVTSRQFIDQDGVEGRVQSLVIRQAQLKTRSAVVAQLVERTMGRDGVAPTVGGPQGADAKQTMAKPAAAALSPPRARQGAVDDSILPLVSKPEPEGMDLRLGHEREAEPVKAGPSRKGDDQLSIDTSFLPRVALPASSLANAADPDLPMPARLESLALSLDRVEREQARRVSGIVKPALEAAGRLRRAFDVAGLPVERYIAKARARLTGSAVGGPFIASNPKTGASPFERELATAQHAVTTLDGLRRALPSVPLRKPFPGELQLTSTFGYRADPFLGRPALHSGVDLREDYGTVVRATAAGVVSVAGPNGGYGNMIEIDHGGGMATRYAHLSAINVTLGQQISPGAVIGRVGSTGRSTGPHLHYEVRIDGEAVDPARFLRAATALGGIAQ